MIDLDKFICDFLSFKLSKEQKNQIPFRGSYYQANAALKYIRFSIDYGLKQQGLEYKEGFIKPIDSMPEPKFKIGDKIRMKNTSFLFQEIVSIKNNAYYFSGGLYLTFDEQDNWESEKPSTIKFNEPDIEEMVEERFKDMAWCYAFGEREFAKREYRKGLEDMWNKLKKNEK